MNIKFSTAMKTLNMLDKMDIDLSVEFDNLEDYGTKVLQQAILGLPKAQDEFLEILNEVNGTEFTPDSDLFDVLASIRETGSDLIKLFQSAFKLKGSIS